MENPVSDKPALCGKFSLLVEKNKAVSRPIRQWASRLPEPALFRVDLNHSEPPWIFEFRVWVVKDGDDVGGKRTAPWNLRCRKERASQGWLAVRGYLL